MSKQIVKTGSVAQPIGPYSLGVRTRKPRVRLWNGRVAAGR